MKIKTNKGLKVTIIAVVLLLCLALAIGITGAFYQAKRQATGTLSMDQGIIIDYNGFDKTAAEDWATWTRGVTLPLFKTNDAQPGQNIPVNAAGIRANAESVNFYARVKLSYKFYNGETPVEFAESTKLIKTSSSFFGTNWVESGDGYFYYAAGSTLNKFEKGTQTFVDLFATDAKFIIEGAGFTGATSDGEGGGFVVGDTSINKIEVYLTLETLQGDADAAAEGWKITEVVKPIEVNVATEEKPDINIDDIISDDKKDGEITIAGDPTAMKTILIGSRAFEGCTNLRLKLNNSNNITYIIASDAFSAGAKIWYGANEATNLLINADTTGKTAGKDNAWVVADPNLKVFLPTGVTQNSTNTSYGKYQYTDDQGTWYFDLIDSNGKTVTLSSNNNMSVSTLSASTYANTNTYTARLKKFEPKYGVTVVVIPKYLGVSEDSNKYAVTEIDRWRSNNGFIYGAFEKLGEITSITIPDSVIIIEEGAFRVCSLTSITIPDSITSIGNYAFESCAALTTITIPNSVTSIGGRAFLGCCGLTSIIVDSGNKKYHSARNCLIETASKTLITGCENSVIPTDGSVTSIGDEAFSRCNGLTSITIPDSVTSIGSSAFYNCIRLTSVTIGSGVIIIGNEAFEECRGLTSITIPDSVTSIGSSAFYNCRGLTSVTIGNGVTSIESGAFSGCLGLTSMHIGAGIQEVSWLPNNVSKIAVTISKDNPYLAIDSKAMFAKSNGELSVSKYISEDTTYNIPSAVDGLSVTRIGDSAFYNCSGLTSITIPDGVTSIGSSAFSSCSGLTSITIPDSVTSIGSSAFYNCSGLTSVTIGSGVTSIGSSAFSSCSGLTSVTIGSGVTSIGSSAFSSCSGLTSITIPDSVTSIEDRAFKGCSGLTSITIPDSVTSIGSDAFYRCSGLTSVVIKGNITEIPDSCFRNCSNLESIVLPSSITTIGNKAFSGCSKLTTIYVDSADATAITGLGFTKVDDTLYDENGIANTSGKYYKYSGAIA